MLQEGKYLDMLTPDANEISMNEQSKEELTAKIKENKALIAEKENDKKKIEELTKKNKELELLVTQQDAKLSLYSAKEDTNSGFLGETDTNKTSKPETVNPQQSCISPEVESLLEDQQHSLELLEEENKQLRKALNQTENKLKKLELVQFEHLEKLVQDVCNTTPNSTVIKKPPHNLTITNDLEAALNSSLNKTDPMQNPTSPTRRNNASSMYRNSGSTNTDNPSRTEIVSKDKEDYYTKIIEELQANLEEEKKKHNEEIKMVS